MLDWVFFKGILSFFFSLVFKRAGWTFHRLGLCFPQLVQLPTIERIKTYWEWVLSTNWSKLTCLFHWWHLIMENSCYNCYRWKWAFLHLREMHWWRKEGSGLSKCLKGHLFTVVWGLKGQISTLGSVNPFFPSFTRTGFSVLVCQTSIWRGKKNKHKHKQH